MYSDVVKTPAAADVLRSTLEIGVRISKTDNQLSYKVPARSACCEALQQFQKSTREILTVLRGISGEEKSEAISTSSQRVDYAPLAFSQLTHWNLHRLMERPSARMVAPAIRMHGSVNTSAIKTSIDALMSRHEALRTRIGMVSDVPIQVIPKSLRWYLNTHDLTVLPGYAREGELQHVLEKHTLKPIDVLKDPLFSPMLIKLDDDEYVLTLAMDHLISDGVSVNILLRDFFEIYECATENRCISLPAISVQLADYAAWQKNMYKSWLEEHGRHWARHLAGCRPMTISKDRVSSSPSSTGLGFVRLRMDPGLRTELVNWSRVRRTTMVLSVLSAFVALVLRWYGTSEAIIQYQTNGRYTPEVLNTLGYFAFRLFLRIGMNEKDTFIDLLNRVQAEFVTTYEHKEFSSMQVYAERADVTSSPCFNWLALDPIEDSLSCDGKQGTVGYSRVRYGDHITDLDDVKTDTELMALFTDVDNEISGAVQFSHEAASVEIIERFGRNFVAFIQTLLRAPDTPIMELKLV